MRLLMPIHNSNYHQSNDYTLVEDADAYIQIDTAHGHLWWLAREMAKTAQAALRGWADSLFVVFDQKHQAHTIQAD